MISSSVTPQSATESQRAQSTRSKMQRFAGKRVAMVTFSLYPYDPRPRRAIDALIGEGASIDLICLESEKAPWRESLNGVNLLRIPLKHDRKGKLGYAYRYGTFIFLSSLIFALRTLSRRYDLVYVHNMPDILVLCSLIPKLFGAKVVLDLHDPMPELMMTIFETSPDTKSVRILKWLEKWSIGRTDLAIAVNLACKRIFSTRSCRAEKLAVVMNAPDGKIFPFREPRPADFTSRDGKKNFVMMYHGSLVERNGLDVAIASLEHVKKSVPSAELRIFGAKTPFLERMMELAREKNVQDSVRYFGSRRLEDLVKEIEQCDVGVIPNHRNAFTEINTPTRIFEYLAIAKPVVAPATPGIQDYFDRDSLLFFEPGNPADLVKQVVYAYSHPAEVLEIVRNAQRVFLEHTWDCERETLLSRLNEVLNTA